MKDPAAIDDLRDTLVDAGYTEDGLATLLGLDSRQLWEAADRCKRIELDTTPLSLLAVFFLLGKAMEPKQLERAIAPWLIPRLLDTGVIRRKGDLMRPRLNIVPFDGMLFAGEIDSRDRNSVPSVYSSTFTTAHLTVRRPVTSALDLGTGCGALALLASRHCERVTGVDLNPQAAHSAALNARLNGVTNASFETGSWFEPVGDEMFDLIVSNPPFVMTPDTDRLFSDGGPGAEAMCRDVIRGAASRLNDGGTASVMCNWATDRSGTWSDAPAAWVDGLGCDAIIVGFETQDARDYARLWNDWLLGEQARYGSTVSKWLEAFEKAGIDAIATGSIVLRKRDGANSTIPLEIDGTVDGPCGEHLMRIFMASDLLAGATDDDLLDEAFTLVEGHRLDQTLSYSGGSYSAHAPVMRLIPGMGLHGNVDPLAAGVVLACDGETPLRELVASISEETLTELSAVRAATLSTVRHLFERGYLSSARHRS